MNNQAAIYLRSSKDRSDVSIAVQRRDLHALAKKRDLDIVEEFVDAVESGKTENRPGFQLLLDKLKSRDRTWQTLILLDTSRLSRRQFISHFFEHEAEKQGVTIIYKSLPDADPISAMMLKAILQAMDQWHSMMSKQKGLAGMAENIRQGFRAGGCAPRGYSLKKIATGAVRDGQPVTKSRLVTNEDAELVAQILKQRALGVSRRVLHSRLNIPWSENSTLGMEWNALTYAGHTVWNVHAERRDGKTIGGSKRRPRSEWQIKKNTHQALITEQEAEAILSHLENAKQRRTRRTPAKYLLTGLLTDNNGLHWHGDSRRYYRAENGRGLRVQCKIIDQAVLSQIEKDLQSEKIVRRLAKKLASYQPGNKNTKIIAIKKELEVISNQIDKIINIMTDVNDASPFLRRVEQLELKRNKLIKTLQQQQEQDRRAPKFNEFEIQRALREIFRQRQELDSEQLKDFVNQIIDKIIIDPKTKTRMVIHYSITIRGFKVASPKRGSINPSFEFISVSDVA